MNHGVDWIDFMNEQTATLRERGVSLEPSLAREAVLARLRGICSFPVETRFRGYVVAERTIRAPSKDAGPDEASQRSFLEVLPAKLQEDAYRLTGGVLFPYDRRLGEGSVLDITVELWDPASYVLHPPAILSDLKDARIIVGVVA